MAFAAKNQSVWIFFNVIELKISTRFLCRHYRSLFCTVPCFFFPITVVLELFPPSLKVPLLLLPGFMTSALAHYQKGTAVQKWWSWSSDARMSYHRAPGMSSSLVSLSHFLYRNPEDPAKTACLCWQQPLNNMLVVSPRIFCHFAHWCFLYTAHLGKLKALQASFMGKISLCSRWKESLRAAWWRVKSRLLSLLFTCLVSAVRLPDLCLF